MNNAILNDQGILIIHPFAHSSAADFDFLHGQHLVHHKKLKSRLNGCTDWETFDGKHRQEPLLKGIGNLEQQTIGEGEGIALRLFNPQTRLWSIHWADSNSGKLDVPMVGSFDHKVGYFYAQDTFNNQAILVKFKWDAREEGKPVWSQAFSNDQGKNWEWNWYMYFEKI